MDRIRARHFSLFFLSAFTLLALLSCGYLRAGSMSTDVTLTTDKPSYTAGETILVTIDNQHTETIVGFTGWTYCTILIVQQRINDIWQMAAGECPLEMRQVPVEISAQSQLLVELAPREADPALPPGEYRIRFTYTIGSETGSEATVYSTPFTIEGASEPPNATPLQPTIPAPGVITTTEPVTPILIGPPTQVITQSQPLTSTPELTPSHATPSPPAIDHTPPLTGSNPISSAAGATVTLTTDHQVYALDERIVVTVANGYDQPIIGFTGQTYCTILIVEQRLNNVWQRAIGECPLEAPPTPVEIPAQSQLVVELTPRPSDPPLPTGDFRIRFTFHLGVQTGPLATVYSQPFSIESSQAGEFEFSLFLSLLRRDGS